MTSYCIRNHHHNMIRHRAPTKTTRCSRTPSTRPSAILDKLFKSSSSNTASKALDELLSAVAGSDRGITTTPAQLKDIKQLFEQLENGGKSMVGTPKTITGTWKLVWTTEKETLFILKNAGIFGTKAGDVYQVVDAADGTLQNVILFPPEGAFIVNSSLEWVGEGEGKTNFQFTGAVLKLPGGRAVNVPPVGKGWFKSVYADGRYRLARDVRGDYLLVEKDGPPREFR